MRRSLMLLVLLLGACEPVQSPAPLRVDAAPTTDGRALQEKGAADAERQSKITPRQRRFGGESL